MIKLTIKVSPMGAPRMTQRDTWKKRPVVLKYRKFKDAMRAAIAADSWTTLVLDLLGSANSLSWTAYFPIPPSYSKKKAAALAGQPHRQKPDRDNVDKAIMDALFKEDCGIAFGTLAKLWDDGGGPRIELIIGTEVI